MMKNTPTQLPWYSHLIFVRPARVQRSLDRVREAGLVEQVPNLWQLSLGVFRMVHRMVTRPESIGLSDAHAVRPTRRARLLRYRPLRLPFLLAQGSVAPWDLSGLLSPPKRLIQHLVGTHHDSLQFVYDLEILSVYPGMLAKLEATARRIVNHDDAYSRLMRDMAIFEGYHEALLATVVATRLGESTLTPALADDPDISFLAYLRWCAEQPETPAATVAAWRAGEFHFDAPLGARTARSSEPHETRAA